MRVNFFNQSGQVGGGIATGTTGTMTGPLILAGNPVSPLEAAPKQYVDTVMASLDAANLKSGTMATARFPAYTGDLSSATGTGTFVLGNSGVVPGTYTKVTVNAKGRILNATSITNDDIPSFSWSKITSGQPSTLAGYGITDAVSLGGGSMTGNLSLFADPTLDVEAVTKQYVDAKAANNAIVNIGDVIRRPSATTPSGYLRLNGAYLNKATNASLYAIVRKGYEVTTTLDHTSYLALGSGKPWGQQGAFRAIDQTDLTNWKLGNAFPGALGGARVIVTENRVIALGGDVGGSSVATIYTAPINADGTIGTWISGGTLPAGRTEGEVVVTKGYVYYLGGRNIAAGYYATVYAAPILGDGSLGTWSAVNSLPGTLSQTQAVVTKSRIYLLGGWNGSASVTTVYSAPINQDGTIGTWITDTALPAVVSSHMVFTTKNRVYLLGGYGVASYTTAVYSAPINADGTIGAWTAGTPLPVALGRAAVMAFKNQVFLIGGVTGASVATATVYTSTIDASGNLGNWSRVTDLPVSLYAATAIALKNSVHIIGGYDTIGQYTNRNYYAPVSGDSGFNDYTRFFDGTINKFDGTSLAGSYLLAGDQDVNYSMPGAGCPWQQQYQFNDLQTAPDLGAWTAATSLPAVRSTQCVIVTKNRVYLLSSFTGGGYDATIITAMINPDGSLGAWTAAGSLPGAVAGSRAVAIKNRIYILGGGYNGSAYVNTSYWATINADGTLGAWNTLPAMPNIQCWNQTLVTRDRVYVIGGWNGSAAVSNVYWASINADGSLGSWATGPSLPYATNGHAMFVAKNRVHIIGGNNGNTVYSTRVSAVINADGSLGGWVNELPVPTTISSPTFYATKNRVYMIGGATGFSAPTATTYSASINADGTINAWNNCTALPLAMNASALFAVKNRLYIAGGDNGVSTSYSNVYYVSLSSGLNDYSDYYNGKITYTDLGVAGTDYVSAGGGRPWDQQYQINSTQSGDITGWTASTAFPVGRHGMDSFVTKNRVYAYGGRNGNTNYNDCSTAVINADGTLGAWTSAGTIPGTFAWATSCVTGNYVYLMGGSPDGTNGTTATYKAPINADGTIGAWVPAVALPQAVMSGHVFATRGWIHYIGGQSAGVWKNTVYSAPLSGDGNMGAWVSAPNLTLAVAGFRLIVTKNRVYIVGGEYSAGNYTNQIASAPINMDGSLGSWTQVQAFPTNIVAQTVYVTKTRVYMIGGQTAGGVFTTNVYQATINDDGTLGNWTTGTVFPAGLSNTTLFAAGGKLYSIGGYNGTSSVTSVYVANISGGLNDYSSYYNGTILPASPSTSDPTYNVAGSGQPWQQQYQINTTQSAALGTWSTDTAFPVTLGASDPFVTKNRVYVIGNWNGAISSAMYTAPINADGSLGAWAAAGNFPVATAWHRIVVTKNRVFVLGGSSNSSSGNTTVYTAVINTDGTLGAWTTSTSLPSGNYDGQAFATKNRVYYIGGFDGTNRLSVVWYAPINPDGTLGAWVVAAPLPIGSGAQRCFVTKNRVFMVGGLTGSNTPLNTVYSAAINPDGSLGNWGREADFPTTPYSHSIYATKNRVYVLGSQTSGGTSGVIYYANINTDGTIGPWTVNPTAMNTPVGISGVFATSTRLYLVGGLFGSAYTSIVQYVPITGGTNDYSSYYDGTVQPADYGSFRLPDFSGLETASEYYYIKT